MSKKHAIWLLLLGMAVGWGIGPVWAQETSPTKVKVDDAEKSATAFRIDFALNEAEEGKTINTRHYSMNLVPGFATSNEIKIGTRVPVEAKDGGMTYIDVGTNI